MIRLGIATKNSNLTIPCAELVDAGYIGEINAKQYGIGYVYYLKKKGAIRFSDTEEDLERMNFVENSPRLQPSTLHHRHGAIWCQIELDLSALRENYQVRFYYRDIERQGNIRKDNNFSRATRIMVKGTILEPDANFMVNERLFAFEYEHQTHTSRSLEKLRRHCDAIDIRALGKEYQVKVGERWKLHRILCVYEKESVMKAVMKKMVEEFPPKYTSVDLFLFKTMDEVLPTIESDFTITNIKDYFKGWSSLSGEKINMLL